MNYARMNTSRHIRKPYAPRVGGVMRLWFSLCCFIYYDAMATHCVDGIIHKPVVSYSSTNTSLD